MRCANIEKASQDEQQNQKTTKKINYIKNFMSVQKTKINNKVEIASDKTETKPNEFYSPEKIWDQSI